MASSVCPYLRKAPILQNAVLQSKIISNSPLTKCFQTIKRFPQRPKKNTTKYTLLSPPPYLPKGGITASAGLMKIKLSTPQRLMSLGMWERFQGTYLKMAHQKFPECVSAFFQDIHCHLFHFCFIMSFDSILKNSKVKSALFPAKPKSYSWLLKNVVSPLVAIVLRKHEWSSIELHWTHWGTILNWYEN